jgi:hypothetical protein
MPGTIRFHLDEHVDPSISDGLKRRGIDVTTTVDAGLVWETDKRHAEYVVRTQRVMCTQDADFLRMHAAGWNHDGIAYCRPHSRSVGEIIRSLVLILGGVGAGGNAKSA